MATDKTRVSAYVTETVKKQAEKLAQSEGRSLSNYIEQLLIREIQKTFKETKK